jgi:hypothetical protein
MKEDLTIKNILLNVLNVKWYKGGPVDLNGVRIPTPTGQNQNRTPQGHINYNFFKYF